MQALPSSPKIAAIRCRTGPSATVRSLSSEAERPPTRLPSFHLLRGIAYFMKEERDRALADFDAVIRLAPTWAAPYAGRGDINYQKGQYEQSVADYEEALRRNPNDVLVYLARLGALYKLGRPRTPPKGIKLPPHLEVEGPGIILIPGGRRLDLVDGKTAWFRKNVESEFAERDRAIALNPGNGAAYVKRAQLFLQFGETMVEGDRVPLEEDQAIPNFGELQAARALADYDRAIRVSPTLAEAFLARGSFFFRRGDYDRAIADLSEALRLRPDDGDAYVSRAKAYIKRKDYGRAVADFGEAIRSIPKRPDLYLRRGLAHEAMGERSKAIADYRKAVETGVEINLVYYPVELERLGVSYEESRRWGADYTIELHQRGITLDPIVIGDAYFDRCIDRIKTGEYDLAAQDCDQSFRLDPRSIDRRLTTRAFAFIGKGEFDHALADLSRVIEMRPGEFRPWFDRGEVHFRKGDFDRAIADFTETLRLHPGDAGALMGRGKAHAQKRDQARAFADFGEAIRAFDQLISGHHDQVYCHYQRGFAYEQLGERDKAIADYRKVLSLDRETAQPEFDLSEEGLKRLGATR